MSIVNIVIVSKEEEILDNGKCKVFMKKNGGVKIKCKKGNKIELNEFEIGLIGRISEIVTDK